MRSTVHPRACGEHPPPAPTTVMRAGSSPRLRGTQQAQQRGLLQRRFIPAPAGNTALLRLQAAAVPVHPRACGEHCSFSDLYWSESGSSPRLRGTHVAQQQQAAPGRFIPAPAGNTCARPRPPYMTPVHPRACGEHQEHGVHRIDAVGSSPRLRGTRGFSRSSTFRRRFIPAPAGNTSPHSVTPIMSTVHPRACGEHECATAVFSAGFGSSPRLRGTPAGVAAVKAGCRFIPAPAGNTPRPPASAVARPVHPRACGEHPYPAWIAFDADGSSPRLRGTPWWRQVTRSRCRFIPAPAGNTASRGGACSTRPVHPRACGEHLARHLIPDISIGSSPRLRGTRREVDRLEVGVRFIPAPAGNTRP